MERSDVTRTVPGEQFRCDGLLGTLVEVTVTASPSAAAEIATAVFDEIRRLERIFNWFDEGSDLRRWSRGEIEPGPELAEVTALAETWRVRSGGAFNPAAGALVTLWDRSVAAGRVPTSAEITDTLNRMAVDDSTCHNLNAIAKGWIIDRAVRAGFGEANVAGLTVNGGGDLLHLGSDPIIVGIEDPHRPYDNVPPLMRIAIRDMALATSGGSRRGWTINSEQYSHVVDPRTGRPQSHIAAASVIAPDVATADAMATILTVVEVEEGLALSESVDIGACIVDMAGVAHSNERWQQAERRAKDTARPGHSQRHLRFR